MKEVSDDVAGPVPDEVIGLMQEIHEICINQQFNHMIPALWLLLLSAIMENHECTFEQTIKRVQDLVKWSDDGTRDEAIAAQSQLH